MDATQTLPKELRFGPTPTMPQARSYQFKLAANDKTSFAEKEVLQFDIPRLQRSYLTKDTYLSLGFNISYTNSSSSGQTGISVCLDTAGIYSMIDKIEVYDYLGSSLLERIEDVAPFVALLLDTAKPDDKLSYSNENMGTVAGAVIPDPLAIDSTANSVATQRNLGPVSGTNFMSGTNGSVSLLREFNIPLLSFLGILSNKFVPLHNGFTLRITLGPIAKGLGIMALADKKTPPSVSPTAAFINPVLVMQILELGATAETLLMSSTGNGPLTFHTHAYRAYNKTLPASPAALQSRTDTIPININVASLTGIFWFMRQTAIGAVNGDVNYRSISERSRNFLSRWSFLYGSSALPSPAGVSTRNTQYGCQGSGADALQELLKARRVNTSVITLESWNKDRQRVQDCQLTPVNQIADTSTNGLRSNYFPVGRFACGLNLQLDPDSTEVVSGLNTNGMATAISAFFDPSIASQAYCDRYETRQIAEVVANIYCQYDAFITVLPGVTTSISF